MIYMFPAFEGGFEREFYVIWLLILFFLVNWDISPASGQNNSEPTYPSDDQLAEERICSCGLAPNKWGLLDIYKCRRPIFFSIEQILRFRCFSIVAGALKFSILHFEH